MLCSVRVNLSPRVKTVCQGNPLFHRPVAILFDVSEVQVNQQILDESLYTLFDAALLGLV